MISQQTIDEIRSNVRLSDIITEKVALTARSGSMVGLCPFHSEKSPSFYVHDSQNYYHCFGCGESGDGIKFVMETQGMSFPDAVEYLASRFGIALSRSATRQKTDTSHLKHQIYHANSIACRFFQKSLFEATELIQAYVNERELTPELRKRFAVGLAPSGWNGLRDVLQQEGVPEEIALAAGLIRRSSKGSLYDTFRGRLMFPIYQDSKHIAGFGGRSIPSLQENDSPKYINTGETAVYQKSKVLFGFPQAVATMRTSKRVYLVEGYMDVIGLHRAGITNAVATCGTALTPGHIERLRHSVERVVCLFDGDNAGRKAASRSFEIFLNSGLDGEIKFLPDGEDPDTFAVMHGNETEAAILALPSHSLLACHIRSCIERTGAHSLDDLGSASKGKLIMGLLDQIRQVENRIEKKELLREASGFLMHTEEEFEQWLRELEEGKVPETETIEEREVEVARCPIKALPAVDRELLFVIMALRDEVSEQILSDGEMCQELHPATLAFVQHMHEFLGYSDEDKKNGIKDLLRMHGRDWIEHWKKAHHLKEKDEKSIVNLYRDCKNNIRQKRIEKLIHQLQERIRKTSGEEQALLSSKLVALVKNQKRMPDKDAKKS